MGELADGEATFAGESDIDQLYTIQQTMGPLPPAQHAAFLKNPRFRGIKFPNMSNPSLLESRFGGVMSRTAIDLMNKLLDMNPGDRYTCDAALRHKMFDNVRSRDPNALDLLAVKAKYERRQLKSGGHRRPPQVEPEPQAPQPTSDPLKQHGQRSPLNMPVLSSQQLQTPARVQSTQAVQQQQQQQQQQVHEAQVLAEPIAQQQNDAEGRRSRSPTRDSRPLIRDSRSPIRDSRLSGDVGGGDSAAVPLAQHSAAGQGQTHQEPVQLHGRRPSNELVALNAASPIQHQGLPQPRGRIPLPPPTQQQQHHRGGGDGWGDESRDRGAHGSSIRDSPRTAKSKRRDRGGSNTGIDGGGGLERVGQQGSFTAPPMNPLAAAAKSRARRLPQSPQGLVKRERPSSQRGRPARPPAEWGGEMNSNVNAMTAPSGQLQAAQLGAQLRMRGSFGLEQPHHVPRSATRERDEKRKKKPGWSTGEGFVSSPLGGGAEAPRALPQLRKGQPPE